MHVKIIQTNLSVLILDCCSKHTNSLAVTESTFGCFFVYTLTMLPTFIYRTHQHLLVLLLLSTLSACIQLKNPSERITSAALLAEQHNWQAQSLYTTHFDLMSFQPTKVDGSNQQLTIYIEGDGLAWLTKHSISTDPTPINSVGLKLALQHPTDNTAYLARPCQYKGGIEARSCTKLYGQMDDSPYAY